MTITRRFALQGTLYLVLLASVTGCGGSDAPTTYPVTGRVTLDGSPVANAIVTFRADAASHYSVGTTDEQGNYTLSTFGTNDGALPGQNIVTVSVAEEIDPSLSREEYAQQQAKLRNKQKSPIPARYADPTTSGIVVTVTEGPNVHDLEL